MKFTYGTRDIFIFNIAKKKLLLRKYLHPGGEGEGEVVDNCVVKKIVMIQYVISKRRNVQKKGGKCL
jgi:hypothetical protein